MMRINDITSSLRWQQPRDFTVCDPHEGIIEVDDSYAVCVHPEAAMMIGNEIHRTHVRFFLDHNADLVAKGYLLAACRAPDGMITLRPVALFQDRGLAESAAALFETTEIVDMRSGLQLKVTKH